MLAIMRKITWLASYYAEKLATDRYVAQMKTRLASYHALEVKT